MQAGVAAVCLVSATACSSKTSDAGSDTPQRVKPLAAGDVAPRFALVSLKGDSLIVGDSARTATLVNVWATWCESCKEEFAELERLRHEFGGRGFDIAAISVDQGSDVKVQKFAEAQGSTFPVAHDAASRITRLYGVGGLPTSFLLDKTGHVKWAFTGDFRLDSATLVATLHSMLDR
jgi:peroxiredoxin